ncbi:TPA: lipopolysaccharide core heptosyltransferase RfaQ [Citrobacter amalonaticus]|uniref:lipopolysaccharide core heptosyltransferase RfaQ n=1 Tax=Citrobacter amalonaticus TaxID=35703 RepID=UPI0008E5A2F9|nr:lipopolysaccharide core heptosyltransferase RfaQ [Citrobacter amalonaticus]SFB13550.1 heptosyltransferase-3 [Citrobacter amalonaticus]HAU5593732.1 lipopolysaccharide core heptosyltransferase RfaQ [Citrobacter amalonaticus]HDP8883010.1 lipopolysaccharide core heptosyltransferase RfaQ [Citrobacter amalonaticus]
MEKPFRKILVIKMRFHGDMLLTTPVISTLKQNYPDAKIDMLLYQDTMPILSENPEINTLYGISNKGTGAAEKIKNTLSLIKTLRNNQYDLVINLTDQWIVALIVRFLHARVKISQDFANRQSAFWKQSFTHLVPYSGEHVVERTLSALKPLGLEHIVTETTMSYRPEHWENMRRQLRQLGVTHQYVVIQPTARQLFKCWDNDKFSRVIDALERRGYQVVLTSGPSADDLACVEEIALGCETKPVTGLAGKTRFTELGALIDHAALFIGVDSAPGHIAAAVKTPVICLFGATDHVFWRPWTDNIIQFWAGDYQPMPKRSELDRNKKYMSVIPVEDVIAATEKLLPQNAQIIEMDAPV